MLLAAAIAENVRMAKHFWRSAPIRVPVLLLWVAVFGGALHAPCTTFFYVAMGATQHEIGNIGIIISAFGMVTAPLYGALADSRGASAAIASAGFCCSFGCLIRAAAVDVSWLYAGSVVLGLGATSLVPSVLAHISACTGEARRASVVGAVSFQISALRLMGKSGYPAATAALEHLGVKRLEERYRVMMGICPAFCIFGWIALAWRTPDGAIRAGARKPAGMVAWTATATIRGWVQGWPAQFMVAAGCVTLVAVAKAIVLVLWPLYLAHRWNWGASEYAWALLAENLASIGTLFVLPTLVSLVGGHRLSLGLSLIASALALLSFVSTRPWLHCGNVVALLAVLSILDGALRTLSSLALPSAQGRAFACLAVLQALGTMLGNLAGTRLYQGTPSAPDASLVATSFTEGGIQCVPLLLASALLGGSAIVLSLLSTAPVPTRGNSHASDGDAHPQCVLDTELNEAADESALPAQVRLQEEAGRGSEREALLQRAVNARSPIMD